MFELINTRRIGKMYHRFCNYIASIRCGEKAIMFGDGYVVMSTEHYEKLKSKSEIKFIGIDMAKGFEHPGGIIVVGSHHPEFRTDLKDLVEEFKPIKYEIPERITPLPLDRQTPAQRCGYSTKIKRRC